MTFFAILSGSHGGGELIAQTAPAGAEYPVAVESPLAMQNPIVAENPVAAEKPVGGPVAAAGGVSPLPVSLPTDDSAWTIEQIERSISELEQSKDIDEATRIQAIENYRAASKNLNSAGEYETCQRALVAETESVSARCEALKAATEEAKASEMAVPSNAPLQELEQLLPQWELQLSALKKTKIGAETESQVRSQRRKELRARMAVIQERLAEATTQLQALSTSTPSPQSSSYVARLMTRRHTLSREMAAAEAELAKYDVEESADIIRLRIEASNHAAAQTERGIAALQKRIKVARQAAAEQSVRQARSEAIAAAPALKSYAERNQELAERAQAIADALAEAERNLKAASQVHEDLIRQFSQTRKKVETVGLTSSVGALLRKQQANLPDVSQRTAAVSRRQSIINDTQYELFEYEDERQAVDDSAAMLDSIVSEIFREPAAADSNPPSPEQDAFARNDEPLEMTLVEPQVGGDAGGPETTTGRSSVTSRRASPPRRPPPHNEVFLRQAAEELVSRRKEYLDALIRGKGQYFDTLIELDTTDRQVLKVAAEYEQYIDERVLWIRSGRALTTDFTLHPSDAWLITPGKWAELSGLLLADVRQRFYLYLVFVIPMVTLIARGRMLRDRIRVAGEIAIRANCRSIAPTYQTLIWTALVAVVWPMFCCFLGWRLRRVADESVFTEAVGSGLLCVGVLWTAAESMRQLCRPMGLGEAHFGWSSHVNQTVRRTLRLFSMFALPLAFVTTVLSSIDQTHGRDSLERVLFFAGVCVTSLTMLRLFRPEGLFKEYLAHHADGWAHRLRYVWPAAMVCVPMSLGGLTIVGYHYTAKALFWRLLATCVFIAAALVLRSTLLRMLMLRRRTLSMEHSRQRAAASVAAAETNPQLVAGIIAEDAKADITAHSEQSRRLVSSAMVAASVIGLWLIWVQVLPALSMLDKYAVWTSSTPAQSMVADGGGSGPMAGGIASVTNSTSTTPTTASDTAWQKSTDDSVVTLSDLGFAILIAVITFVLSRNGPGLLEISVLQQLPVDASVRYAITTLVSYAIVMIGVIAACSTIGLQWSQIQWLATALTFGLAFGLQEMFANFVAGLIILLERPIRVGDIVTVDDVTGVVSKIRIRATSITNWDRKEYVVPNKEFITGRLLNWTLSDKVNRIVIEVGVAYGTDTDLAREILLKVANDHPLILDDPPAIATFEGFGDSSLNLVLRTYLPTLDNRLEVINHLHTEINKAFRAANIEIPFPQRDLHLRMPPAMMGIADTEKGREVESHREVA